MHGPAAAHAGRRVYLIKSPAAIISPLTSSNMVLRRKTDKGMEQREAWQGLGAGSEVDARESSAARAARGIMESTGVLPVIQRHFAVPGAEEMGLEGEQSTSRLVCFDLISWYEERAEIPSDVTSRVFITRALGAWSAGWGGARCVKLPSPSRRNHVRPRLMEDGSIIIMWRRRAASAAKRRAASRLERTVWAASPAPAGNGDRCGRQSAARR